MLHANLETLGPIGGFRFEETKMLMRLVNLLPILLTPVITIITTYLAIHQHRENKPETQTRVVRETPCCIRLNAGLHQTNGFR